MSKTKALVFDLYGTLVSIKTDEHDPFVFQELSKFLSYSKIYIEAGDLHRFYHDEIKRQLENRREEFPEVDVFRVFTLAAVRHGNSEVDLGVPLYAAKLFRSLSRRHFELFPGAYAMLERLQGRYPMALLSDAQRCFTEPEIDSLRLGRFFDHIFLSSDHGYRKPDPRYFRMATDALRVRPADTVYIGDNRYRDLYGAKNAGMKMVFINAEKEAEYDGHRADAVINEVSRLEDVLDGLE